MDKTQIADTCYEYGGRFRIDCGYPRKSGAASDRLLEAMGGHYKVGGRDAAGGIIASGKPMKYLDRTAPKVWLTYELQEVEETSGSGEKIVVQRFMPFGDEHETPEAAEAAILARKGG